MANQFLSLALFLMLLSFFIVMNSVSEYEDSKSKPVLNSLALAFSTDMVSTQRAPNMIETSRAAMSKGDTLEELEGLFGGHIEGFEVTRNRLGTVMHVHTPVLQFERAINIENTQAGNVEIGEEGAFINTMVSLMRAESKGKSYSVDIILNLSDDPVLVQNNNPQNFLNALKRVSAIADALERIGLPKKMISSGLAQGDKGFLDLYFYPYKPFEFPEEIVSGKDRVE